MSERKRPRVASRQPKLEEWIRAALRVGAIITALARVGDLYLMRAATPHHFAVVSLLLFSLTASSLAVVATYLRWFDPHWRELTLGVCALSSLSATVFGVATGRDELIFVSLILMIIGSSAMLPWSSGWQASLSGFCFSLWAIPLAFGHGSATDLLHWMAIAAAAVLAQMAVIIRSHQMAEQAEANRKIRESETNLRKVYEASPAAIAVVHLPDCTYTDVNRTFEQSSGYSREDAIGATDIDLRLWSDLGAREKFFELLRKRGEVQGFEAEMRLRDGTLVPTLISAVEVEIDGQPCAISITRGIMRIKRTEQELVQAREEALAASRAKTEFLSSVSHEIRTPLNAILGMADLLMETPLNDEQRRYLESMVDNGNTLLELINAVLDLARVESGRLSLESVAFDLEGLVDRVVDTLGLRAHEKGLELVARIAPEVPTLLVGDPLRLRQVLINLVGNATKFTERGEVSLVVESCVAPPVPSGEAVIRFTVRDTGIGISANQLERIFSNFSQADSSTTRKYGGTGLGLAISRRLVEMMGGSVNVESELGRGSTFWFTARFKTQPGATRPAAGDTPDLAGTRVLIVEDSAMNRAVLNEILTARGARVTAVSSSDDATLELEKAKDADDRYRLILIDAHQPNRDGFALARAIRTTAGRNAKIIMMLTSGDLTSQLQRLRETGLSHHLVKPIKRADVMNAIARALALRPAPPKPVLVSDGTQPEVRPLRILAADDSADNRALIAAFLKDEPYVIDEAENGALAVERFKREHYDLVLMDVQMPVMDGDEATREIRRFELESARPRTPIVALSAAVFSESIAQSLTAGCDAHVGKPVKRAMLLDVIRRLTAKPQAADGEAEIGPLAPARQHTR